MHYRASTEMKASGNDENEIQESDTGGDADNASDEDILPMHSGVEQDLSADTGSYYVEEGF